MSSFFRVQMAILALGLGLSQAAAWGSEETTSRKILGDYSAVKVSTAEEKVFFDLLLQEYEFVDKNPQLVSEPYRFAVYWRLVNELERQDGPSDGLEKLAFLQAKTDLYNRLSLKLETNKKYVAQLGIATVNGVLALGEKAGLLIDLGRLSEARQNLWQARKMANSACFKGDRSAAARDGESDSDADLQLVLNLLECELFEEEEHGLEAEDLFRSLVGKNGQVLLPQAAANKDLGQIMTVRGVPPGAPGVACVAPPQAGSQALAQMMPVAALLSGESSARQEVVEAYAAFLVRHKRYAEARRLLLKELAGVKALDSPNFIPEQDEADTFHSNWDMAEKLRELGLWQEAQKKYALALKRARTADEVRRLSGVMQARMPLALPSPAVEKLCRRARKACLRGNFQVGQLLYLQALELDPHCEESLRKLSSLALREGKVEEASGYLEQALKINPHCARATVEKARLNLLAQQREEACKLALKALELDSDDRYVLDMAMKVMKDGAQ